jgi:hypothetical protein
MAKPEEITVEVKVLGMYGLESIAVAETVRLPAKSKVKHALRALYDAGAIDKQVYKLVKKIRPPCFLVLNDDQVEKKPTVQPLVEGDVVTVMQITAGG